MKKKKILLYYQDEGGHKSLAEAAKEAIESNTSAYEVVLFAPQMPVYIVEPYRYMSSNFQEGWGFMYKATDQAQMSKLTNRLVYLLTRSQLHDIIRIVKPDIIGTNASMFLSSILRIARKPKIPTFLMVADPYTVHKTWVVYPAFNAFLVPTIEVQKQLVDEHINPGAITLTGWPIRNQFLQTYNRLQTAHAYKFDPNLFTLCIGGSVNGGVHVLEFLELLQKEARQPLQLIIVCGRNKLMYEQVRHFHPSSNLKIHIFEYVQTIAELMSFSDIVVGKAGPNALFESLTLQKPFIVPDKLPGQEDGNSEFIKKHEVGLVCLSLPEGVRHILDLQNSKDLYALYQERIRKAQKLFAFQPKKVADALCSLA